VSLLPSMQRGSCKRERLVRLLVRKLVDEVLPAISHGHAVWALLPPLTPAPHDVRYRGQVRSSGAERGWRRGRGTSGAVGTSCRYEPDAGGKGKRGSASGIWRCRGPWRCSAGSLAGRCLAGRNMAIGHVAKESSPHHRWASGSRPFRWTLPNLQPPRPASQPSGGPGAAVKGLRPDPLRGLTAAPPPLSSRPGRGGHPGAE